MKQKILVVVDMQNDFVDGSLGTKEAVAIIPSVCKKIQDAKADGALIFATKDTHSSNYLDTREGQFLPVPHCIKGTDGWQINRDVAAVLEDAVIVEKYSFGSLILPDAIAEALQIRNIAPKDTEIEIIGLCTDICVIANAILLQNALAPQVIDINVIEHLCAGTTPEKHKEAIDVMKSLQINIV